MPLSHGHQLKVEQEEHDEYVGGRVKEEVFMGVSMHGRSSEVHPCLDYPLMDYSRLDYL